jgi:hypothetical protein
MGRWARRTAIGVPVLFLLIQAVPYGRNHDNPPVVREPPWADAETRTLAKRACFDCHSNETVWPAYSNVAPISWLVQSDVTEGRNELNLSDWHGGARKGERPKEIREAIAEGEMPPFFYTLAHPNARLGDAERRRLAEGLVATATSGAGVRR